MTKPTGNPRGRPPIPEEEKTVTNAFSLGKPLTERLQRAIPKGKRSVFVRQAVKEKLDREHPVTEEGAG